MESKLPKLTSLRKPTQRTWIPSDRLVSASAFNGAKAALTKPLNHNRTVLTENFQNVCSALAQRPTKRHASPEFRGKTSTVSVGNVNRPKLRRSRSANDLAPPINAGAFFSIASKRPGNTLPSIPAKIRKQNEIPVKSLKTVEASSKLFTNKAPTKPATTTKNATATKTVKGAAKPCVKAKIPPYDYKARFNDLVDKHKALKEKHEKLTEQLSEFDSLPEQYEECQNKLFQTETELRNAKVQLECFERQTNSDKVKIQTLSVELETKTEEFFICKKENNNLCQENSSIKTEVIELRDVKETLATNNVQLKKELQDAKEILFKFNLERKQLHNTIMDLKGNIRVFCRVRPPLGSEENRAICSWQYHDETSLEIATVDGVKKQVKHDFSFDQVFPPLSQQTDIFELVSPLIQSAMDGYNVCIFAYGQTGSGKTFTMDGTSSELGIIPRTIDLLFECFNQNKSLGWEYELRASFLEIYNEVLFDLLSNETKDMEIKMVSARSPTEIFVSNLTEVQVSCSDELHKLMGMAKRNRATAATVANERSSRSHAVTQLKLIGQHRDKNQINIGAINLIDLAGSESPKTSTRMDETKKINKSLSELTNVIMALLQKNDHVPYRNSKLTHLLMPSLGGNSKTLMFVNVSPFQDCFVETVKSLRFAASVNSCKVAKAKKNKFYSTNSAILSGPTGNSSASSNSSFSSSMSH